MTEPVTSPTSSHEAGKADSIPDLWRPGRKAMRRQMLDYVATVASVAAGSILLLVLVSILWTLLSRGLVGISWATLTRTMGPPGSGGGLANAIIGSLLQTGLALLMAAPVGLMCGIYLSEYGLNGNHFASVVRFVADMLMSAPSILIGLFIYQLLVVPFGHFSGFSGAVALAVLALPLIVRTTEDMLRLVPTAMREAGAALGAARWRVIIFLCLRSARKGVMTGILLALARMGGETAPLLFTSLGNQTMSMDMTRPMASLPIAIYQYAGASYEDWVQLAWTGALLVTFGVLLINITVRLSSRH